MGKKIPIGLVLHSISQGSMYWGRVMLEISMLTKPDKANYLHIGPCRSQTTIITCIFDMGIENVEYIILMITIIISRS